MDEETANELLGLTTEIVAAHVTHNHVAPSQVADLIGRVHDALTGLVSPPPMTQARPQPAVPIRSSIKHDYLVCLEDGKKLKMLKRYLRTNYDMSPDEYRARWELPRDYPMVAPGYAEQRRGLARELGLGRKREGGAGAPRPRGREPAAEGAPKRRGRPPKASAPA